MTNSDTSHGGQDLEQLRADLESVVAERDQALSELAELKARLTAQAIVTDSTAAQPLPPPPKERRLRLIKGGMPGAAVLAGVEWLRRHREVPAALVAAAVAAAVAWWMWPDPESRPSGEPPPPTVTVTETSVPSLAPPSTTAPTLTPSPGARPSPTPRATPTPGPSGTVMPVETRLPTDTRSLTVAPPTVAPTSEPTATTPTTAPTPSTAPPTREPTPSMSPSCRVRIVVLPGNKLVEVCVLAPLAPLDPDALRVESRSALGHR